ncbi:hypothetical protein PYCCODRAFT_416458 [Trametes coccinea BRFM310]|uniref:Uncharacterized protein n=1 Tax=Trametes coccinea (strain BRFM310) TaxID=1353009 RepID=A0A1Y2IQL2_TRAC3|nr:hypothetical protein PYCCODRAFT_416458 [Trametes coccinea BRFM310]
MARAHLYRTDCIASCASGSKFHLHSNFDASRSTNGFSAPPPGPALHAVSRPMRLHVTDYTSVKLGSPRTDIDSSRGHGKCRGMKSLFIKSGRDHVVRDAKLTLPLSIRCHRSAGYKLTPSRPRIGKRPRKVKQNSSVSQSASVEHDSSGKSSLRAWRATGLANTTPT